MLESQAFELPSQGVVRKYLRMPASEKVVESDEEWSRCGKWILRDVSGDWSWIDGAWVALQALVKQGILLMIKTTTAAFGISSQYILCYTKPGKETIKRAAEAIRRAVNYEGMMHYKINHLTESQIDHRYGHKDVSVYMYSYLGRFYRRDNADLWRLEEDTGNENKTAYEIPFELDCCDSEIADDELPSKSRRLKLIFGPPSFPSPMRDREYIQLFGSLKQEHEGHLSDADRLWMAARRLFKAGVFRGILCEKSPEIADFHFYVEPFQSASSLAATCDTVFRRANVKGFMYFRTFSEGWTDKRSYKFSSEGELYEDYKFLFAI